MKNMTLYAGNLSICFSSATSTPNRPGTAHDTLDVAPRLARHEGLTSDISGWNDLNVPQIDAENDFYMETSTVAAYQVSRTDNVLLLDDVRLWRDSRCGTRDDEHD